jgi:hypothetical protein
MRFSNAGAMAATRVIGALALLVVGGIHFEQYDVAHYSVIPTIGELFLLNFVGASVCGLALLAFAFVRRPLVDALAALGGIAVSAGALAALLISEQTPLFGFMEQGYRLEIVIAIVSEALAIAALTCFVLGRLPALTRAAR